MKKLWLLKFPKKQNLPLLLNRTLAAGEMWGTKRIQEEFEKKMKKMKCFDKFRVTVKVEGGGRHAQAEAVRHGTARVLVDFNQNFRKRLRKAGFLTRDPRMRERKK